MTPVAQRFADAARILIGDGPIKQRLARAYAAYLDDLAEPDLPPPLRPEFEALQRALSRVAPAGSVTRVRASVQKMSPVEASAHAGTILKIYVELMNPLERAEPLKVVSGSKSTPQYVRKRT